MKGVGSRRCQRLPAEGPEGTARTWILATTSAERAPSASWTLVQDLGRRRPGQRAGLCVAAGWSDPLVASIPQNSTCRVEFSGVGVRPGG